MKLFPYILGPVRVLDITLTADSHTTQAWRCKYGRDPQRTDYDAAEVAKGISVVTVSGHGTVTKPAASQIAVRVKADPQTFITSERGGQIAFVRRERLHGLLDELAAAGIHPQQVVCGQTAAACVQTFFDRLGWRDLLRTNARASALAQAAVRRALPVWLGALFLLLCVNAVVGPGWQSRRQTLMQARQAQDAVGTQSARSSLRQRQLLESFRQRLPVDYWLLADRIGRAVPPEVALLQLELEPLAGRIEAGKPVKRAERTVRITGRSRTSSAITGLNETLTRLPAVREVRLTQVERVRDDERLQCQIELRL